MAVAINSIHRVRARRNFPIFRISDCAILEIASEFKFLNRNKLKLKVTSAERFSVHYTTRYITRANVSGD